MVRPRYGVLLHLFDQVRDDLGVCFCDELVALLSEFALEVKIIFDDAVMNYDEAAGAVAMRVGIFFRGAAVGGPARVTDAEGASTGFSRRTASRLLSLPGARRTCSLSLAGCRRRCPPNRSRGIRGALAPR